MLKRKADLEALRNKPPPETCLEYEVVPQVAPPSARQHCSGERTCKHRELLGPVAFQPAHSYASGSVFTVSRPLAMELYQCRAFPVTHQDSLSPTVRAFTAVKSFWVVSSTFLLLLVLGRSFSMDSSKVGILSSPLPEVDASAPAAAPQVKDTLLCSQGRQCLHPGDLCCCIGGPPNAPRIAGTLGLKRHLLLIWYTTGGLIAILRQLSRQYF